MKTKLDFVGMALSIGCIIHCLFLPLILPMLPMLGFALDHDSHSHLILAAIIAVIAAITFVPGYFKHKKPTPAVFGVGGLALITGMGIAEGINHSPLIIAFTVVGSVFITFAHYLNHKYLCSCACKHNHDT